MKIIRYLVILTLFFSAMQCSGQKRQMYDSLNSIRAASGKPELKRDYMLELKAKIWLIRMQRYGGRLVHGSGPEVLTKCYEPITCWINSAAHRRLLMSDRKRIGIAMYRDAACGKLR